jgi:hypothetical protein
VRVEDATTVAEVIRAIDAMAPGLGFYICDERGRLRRHVNIFVDEQMIADRGRLSDRVPNIPRVDPRDPDRMLIAVSTAWVVPGKADSARMAIDGGLFVARTNDGGQSWQQLREGLPQEHAYDVVYRHALDDHGDCLAFGSTTGNLYVSENRGDSWHSVANNLPPIYSVRFA